MHSVHAHGAGKVRVAAPPRCLKSVYQRFSSFSLRMAIVNSEFRIGMASRGDSEV